MAPEDGIDTEDLDAAVELVLLGADKLLPEQLKQLDVILSQYLEGRNDKPLTLFEQMMQMRKTLQKLNDNLFDPNGRAKAAVGTKDVKDGISSIATLTKMLADLEEQVYTSERARRIESVLIQTLKSLPDSDQQTFFTLLEANFIASNTLDYSEELSNAK